MGSGWVEPMSWKRSFNDLERSTGSHKEDVVDERPFDYQHAGMLIEGASSNTERLPLARPVTTTLKLVIIGRLGCEE